MDELSEMQLEALKSAIEERLRQLYLELDEIFKAHNVTDLNNELSSSFHEDRNSENNQEVGSDKKNNWQVKIFLTSKKISNKPSEILEDYDGRVAGCKIVSFEPFVIECD